MKGSISIHKGTQGNNSVERATGKCWRTKNVRPDQNRKIRVTANKEKEIGKTTVGVSHKLLKNSWYK